MNFINWLNEVEVLKRNIAKPPSPPESEEGDGDDDNFRENIFKWMDKDERGVENLLEIIHQYTKPKHPTTYHEKTRSNVTVVVEWIINPKQIPFETTLRILNESEFRTIVGIDPISLVNDRDYYDYFMKWFLIRMNQLWIKDDKVHGTGNPVETALSHLNKLNYREKISEKYGKQLKLSKAQANTSPYGMSKPNDYQVTVYLTYS